MSEHQVEQLVTEYRAGQVDRREFLRRATVLLGGGSMATALLLAAQGASITTVAHAAGQIAPTAQATGPATVTADIETSSITFKTASDTAPGYLAKPKGAGPFPAVIVIQEWWGLDEHIKSVADRFARQGFAAVAPDLYRGQVAKEPSDAQRLVMSVQQPKALEDVQGAVDYLVGQSYVKPGKAAVIGFCFGGRIAYNMAYAGKNIGAVAVFYGSGANPTDDDLKNVSAPIIGLWGEADNGTPAARIQEWQTKLKQFGKINEMYIYKGAPHAFFNDARDSYRPEAAQDAWVKVLAWFRTYLTDAPAMAGTMAATMAQPAMVATPAATPAK